MSLQYPICLDPYPNNPPVCIPLEYALKFIQQMCVEGPLHIGHDVRYWRCNDSWEHGLGPPEVSSLWAKLKGKQKIFIGLNPIYYRSPMREKKLVLAIREDLAGEACLISNPRHKRNYTSSSRKKSRRSRRISVCKGLDWEKVWSIWRIRKQTTWMSPWKT